MKTNRRHFIKQSTLAIAGTSLLSSKLFAGYRQKEIVGIQLYSVRDDMHKAPLPTLQALAKQGYKNVEHANYVNRKFYGFAPTEFKKILDDLGMKMPSGHTVLTAKHWDASKNEFTDVWKYTVEDAATVGQRFVISPWLDESLRKNMDDLKRFLDIFNKSGELCRKHGMKFGYHNHDFEFKYSLDNKKLYDIILEYTDPKLVIQQIDIGNMYGAGGRALEILKAHPGRFASMHVKDEIKSSGGEMSDGYESTVLGKGILPVKEIVDLARKQGTLEFIIEQESYQGKAPIDCTAEDLNVMKSWGFSTNVA
jgi:sugar phosphate isomerase/epimerase